MKNFLLTLAVILLYCLPNFAQVSGSVKLGLSAFQGDMHRRSDDNIKFLDNTEISYGIGLRVPLKKQIGLRIEGTYFNLNADESNFAQSGHQARGWSFENKFIELSGLLDWELLGKRRFLENGGFRRTLTPVVFGGVGMAFSNPEVDWNNSTVSDIVMDEEKSEGIELVVPVGLGLKYYLSERFAIGLEGGLRLPISDYYDGVSLAANPDKNDLYYFAGAKAYFSFGKRKDTDGDGIVDRNDLCPEVPGIKIFGGCPDTDGDGVADKDDTCPNTFGLANFMGCPDTDEDGIADRDDKCPTVKGEVAFAGCPDTDKDGIADNNDDCPNVAGSTLTGGCPDSDGDGILDKDDKCPTVAGLSSKAGCPVIDTDEDGIEDELDSCPNIKGPSATKGCPDSDNDGVANKDDKCPTTPARTFNGCPEPRVVIQPTTTVIDLGDARNRLALASRNIHFETSSSNMTAQSIKYLNDIVNILNEYPSQNVCINGYTDNVGNAISNQTLSDRRANATFNYLANKGISPSRMNYSGYGEVNPISSNDTREGRKMNRRVEVVFNNGTCK